MKKFEICSKDCNRLASIYITPIANSCNDIAELNLHVNEDINVIGFRKNGLWIPVSCCLPYEKYFCTLRYLANQFFLTIYLLLQGLYDPENTAYAFVKDWYVGQRFVVLVMCWWGFFLIWISCNIFRLPGVNSMGKFGWFPGIYTFSYLAFCFVALKIIFVYTG